MKNYTETRKLVRIPLLAKLVALTVSLVIFSVLIGTWKSSAIFEEVSTDREQNNQQMLTQAKASEAEALVKGIIGRMDQYSGEILNGLNSGVFESDKDFVYIQIESLEDQSMFSRVRESAQNENIFLPKDSSEAKNLFSNFLSDQSHYKESLISGTPALFSSQKKLGLPYIIIGIPIRNVSQNIVAISWAIIRPDFFQQILKKSENTYFVDSTGHTIADTVEKNLLEAKYRFDETNSSNNNGSLTQKTFGKNLVSSTKTNFGATVVSTVSKAYLNAPTIYAKEVSFFIMGIVVSVAFFLSVVFAQRLTSSIEQLVELTKEVAQGNFNINATEKITSKDEVQNLAIALDEMAHGLKEREKIKTMFSKFHGSEITETIMNEEEMTKGKRRDVVVFFSDIRGFTSFSEGKSPEEIVEMLNEYFTVMVTIIQKHHGVVDKFVGDAIMAVWGAPKSHGNDAELALNACLEMRKALDDLNISRASRNQPAIKMGMGLHAGPALSGTIGCDSRLEFTVIGDTVNTASRIESATKHHGTDLLVSEEIHNRLKENFIYTSAGRTQAKGKNEALQLYKVEGIIGADGIKHIIKTPWSHYEADHEEEKIKIAS